MSSAAPQPRCLYCNSTTHNDMQCPRVSRFEFDTDGSVTAVEFFETISPGTEKSLQSIAESLEDIMHMLEPKVKEIKEIN